MQTIDIVISAISQFHFNPFRFNASNSISIQNDTIYRHAHHYHNITTE